MTSKFGGEPVDIQEPTGSKFGGQLVERPSKSISKREGDPTALQQLGAGAYGLTTELLGAPGEIEEFLTVSGKGERLGGEGQFFPTVKQVREKAKEYGIEPAPRTKVAETAGTVTGAIIPALPKLYTTLGKVAGETTKEGERIAGIAERLGFKLAPSQVRADTPVAEKGAWSLTGKVAKENQLLANRLASKGTGKTVDEISDKFLKERIKTLGNEFDKVYKGKQFNIDPAVAPVLQNLSYYEQQLGFAGVGPVKSAADSILNNIQTGKIAGDDLQRLRNALTQAARTTENRGKAHEIYQLVDTLDAAVESRNPGLKAKLDVIRPQYRNTVILEDLYNNGGIRQGNISLERLGNQLSDSSQLRRNPQDIDNLGMLGSQLGLRARWQSTGEDIPELVKGSMRTHGMLPEAIRKLTGPLRGTTARKAQKSVAEGRGPIRTTAETLGATLAPYEAFKATTNK